MFEAILVLCLAAGSDCRPVLLPGYEAPDHAGCQGLLDAMPPVLEGRFAGLVPEGDVTCRAAGRVLDFAEVAPVFFTTSQFGLPAPDVGQGADTLSVKRAGYT